MIFFLENYTICKIMIYRKTVQVIYELDRKDKII